MPFDWQYAEVDLQKQSMIIFGAGKDGDFMYRIFSSMFDIVAFCDNDEVKQRTPFCGLPVLSPRDLVLYSGALILIASYRHFSIARQLYTLNIRQFWVLTRLTGKVQVISVDLNNVDTVAPISGHVLLTEEAYAAGSNASALFDFACSHHTGLSVHLLRLKSENVSREYYRFLQADALVVDQAGVYCQEFTEHTVFQLWHGMPIKAYGMLENDRPFDYQRIIHARWRHQDYILTESPMESLLISTFTRIHASKFIVTGSPKNDYLTKDKDRQLMARILNRKITTEKIIVYMPTFRISTKTKSEGNENGFIFNMPDFNEMAFNQFLRENDLLFVLKGHPIEASYLKMTQRYSNICYLEDEDFVNNATHSYRFFNCIDIGVTDYSSICLDLLVNDTPFIYTPLDIEQFRENRGILLEPYDYWTAGPKVYNMKQLEAEIQAYLVCNTYYKKEREHLRNILHSFTDGKNCERVLDAIKDLLYAKNQTE